MYHTDIAWLFVHRCQWRYIHTWIYREYILWYHFYVLYVELLCKPWHCVTFLPIFNAVRQSEINMACLCDSNRFHSVYWPFIFSKDAYTHSRTLSDIRLVNIGSLVALLFNQPILAQHGLLLLTNLQCVIICIPYSCTGCLLYMYIAYFLISPELSGLLYH